MSSPFLEFAHWVGVWTGVGEAQAGMPVGVRNEVFREMDGAAIGFHFEAFDPGLKTLYHGVRAILCAAPSGVERAIVYSTIHGSMILERTADDEGVIALSGESQQGNKISVTMVQEAGDEMLFTAFWRGPGEKLQDDPPRMTAKLKRVYAWKPPAPSGAV